MDCYLPTHNQEAQSKNLIYIALYECFKMKLL
jgi:hypothetical protein